MPDVQLSLDGDGDLVLTPEMLHPSFELAPGATTPVYDALLAEQVVFDPETRLAPLPLPVLVLDGATRADECGEPFPCGHRAHNPMINHPVVGS